MKTLIEVKHVRKIYRMGSEKILALNDISLKIRKGEILCLVGTSGSGKSTFLNMVAGLEKPTRGEIYIGGIPIHQLNEEKITLFRQKNIGFIFQSFHLLPMLTALENVSIPLVFRGVEKKKREQIGKAMLEAVGLFGYEKRKPSQMSGGQQQRVGIARALAGDPKIIFADEPTGNLDSATSREVMTLMTKMVREKEQTLLIVTHDREVAKYADRIVTIQDGKILGIEETNPEIEEINREIEEINPEIEEINREIEEINPEIEEINRETEEINRETEEINREIGETNQESEEKNQEIEGGNKENVSYR